ncbi:hypothetical protein SAY87_024573 [Trapa incisa]|uniref:Uncharacterized protein n=1 Tax=Trapa incisa TaxID=236973 RepID=A0AAN7GEK7_9MYRT|nr:hypothetical protein SAY87_024573 [Trapa incisa]
MGSQQQQRGRAIEADGRAWQNTQGWGEDPDSKSVARWQTPQAHLDPCQLHPPRGSPVLPVQRSIGMFSLGSSTLVRSSSTGNFYRLHGISRERWELLLSSSLSLK